MTLRRRAATAAVVASWLVAVPLLGLWGARTARLDDRSAIVFAVQTLTPVLYLPAYGALVVALVRRRWILLVAALVLVTSHLARIRPDLAVGASTKHADGESFTVAAVNVAASNSETASVAADLARLDADVLVVLELTPPLAAELERSRSLEPYPHRLADPRSGFFGSAIYSRFPIRNTERLVVVGHPTVRADVVVGEEVVHLAAVHTRQPLAGLDVLRRQLDELAVVASTTTGPLVLAGDFNASHHHAPFRALLRTRVRDAHLDRARGFPRTWPVGSSVPPFALLDHVLVSDELGVVAVEEFDVTGSDHRGVIARLQLR